MNPQAWPNNLSLSVIGSPGHGDEEWRSSEDGRRKGGASESEGAKRRPFARRERAPSTLQGKSISQRFGFGIGKVENDAVKPSERSKGVQWDENARSENSKVWLWD